MPHRRCPRCKLLNPESSTRCECGYELSRLQFTEAALTAVDMSWGDTFFFCLKFGLCAIPAIWIAWFAWNMPSLLLNGAAAVMVTRAADRVAPPSPGGLPPRGE